MMTIQQAINHLKEVQDYHHASLVGMVEGLKNHQAQLEHFSDAMRAIHARQAVVKTIMLSAGIIDEADWNTLELRAAAAVDQAIAQSIDEHRNKPNDD